MIPIPADQTQIQALPLFAAVDSATMVEAMSHFQVLALDPGELLLEPGQSNDRIFLLIDGQASVHLPGETGMDPIPIHAGESVGELSSIDREPVSAEVRCDGPCRFLAIGRDVFLRELAPLPGVCEAMLRGLSGRLRNTNRLALDAQRRTLELAHLQKELKAARKLQEALLPLEQPLLPDGHRLQAASRMRSASAVSGDLFDLVPLDGDRVFVCIGDVSGHGLGAALFMARTVGLLRLLAHQIEAPGQLLASLNDRLCESPSDGHFLTLFCEVLDGATGHFVYANAGHCPPVILQSKQNSFLPVPRSVLLAAFPGISYEQMATQINPGEGLLLYTDGLTEAENDTGEPFGLERCLHQPVAATPEAWLEQLLESWMRFSRKDPPADDCALLALRRISHAH